MEEEHGRKEGGKGKKGRTGCNQNKYPHFGGWWAIILTKMPTTLKDGCRVDDILWNVVVLLCSEMSGLFLFDFKNGP